MGLLSEGVMQEASSCVQQQCIAWQDAFISHSSSVLGISQILGAVSLR